MKKPTAIFWQHACIVVIPSCLIILAVLISIWLNFSLVVCTVSKFSNNGILRHPCAIAIAQLYVQGF